MKIDLPPATHEVLVELAWSERREPAAEAEHLVIGVLHALGLVSWDGTERLRGRTQ